MKKLVVLCVGVLLLASCASQTTVTSVDNETSSSASSESDSASQQAEPAPSEPEPDDVVDAATEAAEAAAKAAEAAAAADAAETTTKQDADEATDSATDDAGTDDQRRGDEFTDDEIQCLEDAGYDPFDLIQAGIAAATGEAGGDEERVYNELFRCAPNWALSDAFVTEFTAGIGEGIEGDVSNEEGRCVVQELIDTGSGGSVLFGGDPTLAIEFFELCLTPENAAELFGAPGTGPQTYGDNAAYDLLQDRCLGDGDLNDIACDVLYFSASVDSDYEAIALTCGDRQPFSDISCADDMVDNNGDLFIDPDSPGVAAVETACRDGAMIACDYLYSLTEFGSSTEQLGGTCGDRGDFDGLNLCVERFGEQAN